MRIVKRDTATAVMQRVRGGRESVQIAMRSWPRMEVADGAGEHRREDPCRGVTTPKSGTNDINTEPPRSLEQHERGNLFN